MSSARNHAKRSHRSEHLKGAYMSASARKVLIRSIQRPKHGGFLERLFHRKAQNAEG